MPRMHSPIAGGCASRPALWRTGRSVDYARAIEFGKMPDASRCSQPLLPLVTLAAGVFLLVAPRIVSVAVAIYLVITGLLGLNAIYHFFW